MQKASYLNKDPINIINSQNISQHKSIATINPKANTHTQQVQTILYFKNKLRQFREHKLTHVKPCSGQITLYQHMYQK